MEENQFTTPVEETPAEAVNESTQNETAEQAMQESAAYVAPAQAAPAYLTGLRLGHLMVVEPTAQRSAQGSVLWRCRCDCGNESLLPASHIKRGHITDCGCRSAKERDNADITGQQFGRLTPLYVTDRRDHKGYRIWHCRCECGKEVDVSYKNLVYSNQQSCGCKKKEHDHMLRTYLTHVDGTSINALKSSKVPSNNTTGVTGVHFVKGRYLAKIIFQKKQYYLGTYSTLQEAAAVRRQAEKLLKDDVVAYYEQWAERAVSDPTWAKENPIHFHVSKDGTGSLKLQVSPKLFLEHERK